MRRIVCKRRQNLTSMVAWCVLQGAWLRNLSIPYILNERTMFATTIWEPSGDL